MTFRLFYQSQAHMDSEVKSPPGNKTEAGSTSSPKSGDLKICGVCGDRALGYNFNALTCESCKAFFRRNALKNKEFRCPFKEICEITAVTRRFCQRCRLMKCLNIGMRKDYIMSDEDKVIKKKKIEQNRAKKRPCTENSSHFKEEDDNSGDAMYDQSPMFDADLEPMPKVWVTSTMAAHLDETYTEADKFEASVKTRVMPSASQEPNEVYHSPAGAASVPSPNSPPDSATVAAARSVEMVTNSTPVSVITSPTPLLASLISSRRSGSGDDEEQACFEEPAPSTFYHNTKDAAREILQDVQRTQRRSVTPNSIESILSEAIKLEFEAYSSLSSTHHSSRELNDAERAKLNELIVANKALHDPLDHDLSALVGDDCRFKANVENSPMLLDVINLTAIAIRRLIKTSKKINAFKNMCQEDQVALLKGGCTEMLILRSAMTYDPDKNSWNIPHTQERLNVKVDVLKEARGNIYDEHQRFLRTFELRWRTDENIMLILGAITLFTPDRPRVVHHDVIKLEQNSYYYLLRRYLESIYQGCEARSTFLKMIQKIAELHRLNDEHVKVYLDVNPRDVEPLLIEIFDLNSATLRPDRTQ